ncbi:aryl-alcohol dehydrogenase-like predicted oxidoreductase [Roseinatronobacter thiooxidans]|uniref:Aryl-alcohol dehydrogenase-like predicted oxidoreductase n=1 Tax=Roseinatronobacter thiooxidans TaxID=121821 RepID=A0A2W7QL89_9RHOB|nr:aldo/keto reductase [Roseinatronobacter thiooxidans]PZX48066.1 aryl-alcohol dehydrogenase-like predicted oxidoreductase [Roseinatronobacter thiooxidans]
MQKLKLGHSDLMVSRYCMGTMTFGTQTDEHDAHRQLDMAREAGINFLDAAEMYPVNPVRLETAGDTEAIVGRWIASRKPDDIVVATKITGAGSNAVKDGAPISATRMRDAVEASLRRLQVECIDIYQLHWPNRGSYHFRKVWGFDPSNQKRDTTVAHMREVLSCAAELIAQGKIKHLALSNESAWGLGMWLHLAEAEGLPRVVSLQNEYSLLCRLFDLDLAEACVNENIPLLAYSPLAAGLLTGKYAGNVTPEDSRRARNPDLGGRITGRVFEAVSGYMAIAHEFGLDPVHMAIQWTCTRPAQTLPIIGATTSAQLGHILAGRDVVLPDEVKGAIDQLNRAMPMVF